ncbi:MAG: hypothetical protein M0R06_22135 [Sphaerochaeta sp.]|jgi:broad-specificity NMP kinase|nr:hypothetical protein [Sphaerochaeta sp.]
MRVRKLKAMLNGDEKVIWIHGPSGSGKTTLAQELREVSGLCDCRVKYLGSKDLKSRKLDLSDTKLIVIDGYEWKEHSMLKVIACGEKLFPMKSPKGLTLSCFPNPDKVIVVTLDKPVLDDGLRRRTLMVELKKRKV